MNKALSGVVLDGSGTSASQVAQSISVPQGETFVLTVTVKKQDGTAFDLTGYAGILTLRRTRLSSTATLAMASDTIAAPLTGVMTFTGVEAYTADVTAANYVYDCWILHAAAPVAAYRIIPETDENDDQSVFAIEEAVVDLTDPVSTPTTTPLIGLPSPIVASKFIKTNSGGTGLEYGDGAGTVTSVDLTVPNILSVSGNPVTSSGTLAVSLATQTANKVLASGSSGGAATPAFRALVAADLPSTAVTPGSYTAANITVDAQGRLTAAANGSGGGGSGTVTNVTGTSPIAVATGTTTPVVSLNDTAVTPASYTYANITVDQKGRLTAASSGHGEIWYSIVDRCNSLGGQVLAVGSDTVGIQFALTAAATITGGRFYWAGGAGAKTVRITLWDSTNASVKTVDVSVNGAGIYTGTFASSYALTTTFKTFHITMWETTGGNYTYYTLQAFPGPMPNEKSGGWLEPAMMGPHIALIDQGRFSAGNAVPASTQGSANAAFPIEPIFTVP